MDAGSSARDHRELSLARRRINDIAALPDQLP
jgi:hypothetical protein